MKTGVNAQRLGMYNYTVLCFCLFSLTPTQPIPSPYPSKLSLTQYNNKVKIIKLTLPLASDVISKHNVRLYHARTQPEYEQSIVQPLIACNQARWVSEKTCTMNHWNPFAIVVSALIVNIII